MSSIRYLFTEGIKNIFTNRLMAFASFGVLVCCLLMMGCSLLFVLNVNEAFESVEEQNVMQVYIKDGVDQETIDAVSYTHLDVYKRQVCVILYSQQLVLTGELENYQELELLKNAVFLQAV